MESLKRKRKREHRCFELAGMAMINEPGAEKFTLVHGIIRVASMPISHAWILTGDGRTYDPVENEYMPAEQYAAAKRAIAERQYTQVEAATAMRANGHYGPWHESAGISRVDERSRR